MTEHHPRRGSLAFKPRSRAKRMYPSLKIPENFNFEGKILTGFGGYKVGMTRVLNVEEREGKQIEVVRPVTIVECPPMFVYGVRVYQNGFMNGRYGIEAKIDYFVENVSKDLKRKTNVKKTRDAKELEKLNPDEVSDIRLLVHTQPSRIGFKKTPENFELPLFGKLSEKVEKAKEFLRKEIRIGEVFSEGEFVDVLGVTKGKGRQGPIKRHNVKLLGHKTEKGRRHAGNMGSWHPAYTDWRAPLSGQMGLHNRTEYNKLIMKIGKDIEEINPQGGFKNYGLVKEDYLLISGSIPGVPKRFILFRPAVRTKEKRQPQINYILR